MIKFTVEAKQEITQRQGTMKNNKPFPREQTVYAYVLDREGNPQPHPQRAKITLWDGEEALKPGTYTLAPQSIYIDKYGAFALAPKVVAVGASGRGGAG